MLCPNCKHEMQKLFEVKSETVVFGSPFKFFLDGVKPSGKRKRVNRKVKPMVAEVDAEDAKPKPMRKAEVTRVSNVALYYCPDCLVFCRGV